MYIYARSGPIICLADYQICYLAFFQMIRISGFLFFFLFWLIAHKWRDIVQVDMLLFYMLLKAPEETQRTPAMIRPSQQTVMTKAVTDLSPADSLPVCCSLHTKGSCTAMEFNHCWQGFCLITGTVVSWIISYLWGVNLETCLPAPLI